MRLNHSKSIKTFVSLLCISFLVWYAQQFYYGLMSYTTPVLFFDLLWSLL